MEVAGVRSVAEVRRHLNTFVKTELFRGEDPPPEFSRRHHPTDADIRNILYMSRIGDRKAPDDQINLGIKCTEWQEENPDDFVFYRVNQKQLCPEMECKYLENFGIINLVQPSNFVYLAINSREPIQSKVLICLSI
jgi:hypothetical protein